jgi:hypothetical protein
MLSDDVVDAVREGQFHVWAVDNVDQGIEILTATPAGEGKADGSYPEGSIHRLVGQRLQTYAKLQRAFASTPNGKATASRKETGAKTEARFRDGREFRMTDRA